MINCVVKVKGNTNFNIIQGDTFAKGISFGNLDLETIEKICFSCAELNIIKDFKKEYNEYYLEISAEETATYPVIVTDCDITILFKDKTVETIKYRTIIEVLEKINKVVI